MKKDFQSNLQYVVEAFHLPGMAVIVVQQGEVVFSQGLDDVVAYFPAL